MMEAWKRADANGDGLISRAEFDAMPRISNLEEGKRQALFGRLDKDGDGNLSREEIARMGRPQDGRQGPPMPRLAELDKDKSGGISLEEFKAGEFFKKLPTERQEKMFERLDTDGDGQITPKDRPKGGPEDRPRGPEGERRPQRPDGDRRMPERSGGKGPKDLRGILGSLDKNSDGKVDFEEFQQAPYHQGLSEDEQEDRFEGLDKNGDLVLDGKDAAPQVEREKPKKAEVE